MPLKSRLVSVIGDEERLVSSIDVVVGEPTTAAALRLVADWPRGRRALPATLTLTGSGVGGVRR